MTLATFFPFTTTDLYQHAFRFLPRHHLMQLLMILLTILMVSNVRYATMPRAGVRTLKGLLGLATILFILIFGILEHDAFFFPLRSEERRVGKSVDLGGRRIIKKKKRRTRVSA